MKKLVLLLLLPIFVLLLFFFGNFASAECQTSTECAEEESRIRQSLNEASKQLESLSNQLKSASYDYSVVLRDLEKVEGDLAGIQAQLNDKKQELDKRLNLRNFLVRLLYKQSRISPLEIVFADEDLAESVKNLSYYQENFNQIQSNIAELNSQIAEFEGSKKSFEELKAKLDSQRASLSSTIGRTNYLISYYKNQEIVLGSDLNAAMQRQALLAWQEKQAGNGKQSLGGAGAFTFYGYGTEHGVGMSQYGAKMLADQGKNGEEIILFYYPGVQISSWDTSNRFINTACAGVLAFEDQYLAGIGEILNSWPSGVKEAQIIAARSYAYVHTFLSGGSGPAVSCGPDYQVYAGGDGKLDAVNATRGRVAINPANGGIARLYYHSTSGPHTDNIWDSPSFSCSQGSCPYLGRVDFNDTDSPYNNWCGNAATWSPGSPPPLSCTGSNIGNPLTNADLEFLLNASMLKYKADGGHLEDVGFNTTPQEVESWLQQEGTTPIHGLQSIAFVRVGGSSDRVRWVTAVGSTRTIGEGLITGKRFRYIYNILSPQADFLWSTWFYVK